MGAAGVHFRGIDLGWLGNIPSWTPRQKGFPARADAPNPRAQMPFPGPRVSCCCPDWVSPTLPGFSQMLGPPPCLDRGPEASSPPFPGTALGLPGSVAFGIEGGNLREGSRSVTASSQGERGAWHVASAPLTCVSRWLLISCVGLCVYESQRKKTPATLASLRLVHVKTTTPSTRDARSTLRDCRCRPARGAALKAAWTYLCVGNRARLVATGCGGPRSAE